MPGLRSRSAGRDMPGRVADAIAGTGVAGAAASVVVAIAVAIASRSRHAPFGERTGD